MATAFDRWEKDPFFYAAEEVQESADRMESVYRRWIYGKTGTSRSSNGFWDDSAVDLRRDLHATLATAKWQLEEFERAMRHNDAALLTDDATVTRHKDFIEAISSRIGMVEKALKEFNLEEEGERALTWVRLDKGESDELALFLSSSGSETEKVSSSQFISDHEAGGRMDGETSVSCKIPPCQLDDLSSARAKGHHRIASSSTELGTLTISVMAERTPPISSDKHVKLPPPRLQSLSELRTAESSSKPNKGYRNGFKKWKALSHEDVEESLPLRNNQLSRGMNACYEKSKSCLSDCTDESCNKNHHEWLGALQTTPEVSVSNPVWSTNSDDDLDCCDCSINFSFCSACKLKQPTLVFILVLYYFLTPGNCQLFTLVAQKVKLLVIHRFVVMHRTCGLKNWP